MKILLIEDDKRLAKLVRGVLEEEHYSVEIEMDGENGLECALRGIHDLIILDWMLPEEMDLLFAARSGLPEALFQF